jgi:hypothetical protein
MVILALGLVSSTASLAESPAAGSAARGQVVTLSPCVAQAMAGGPDARISRANLGLVRRRRRLDAFIKVLQDRLSAAGV